MLTTFIMYIIVYLVFGWFVATIIGGFDKDIAEDEVLFTVTWFAWPLMSIMTVVMLVARWSVKRDR